MPQPAGRDQSGRRRLETRNRLLTALLRRPPAVVVRTLASAWRDDRGAVLDAVRELRWALRQRHRLPPAVESDLITLAAMGD